MEYRNEISDLEEQGQINEYLTPREVMDLLYIGKNTFYGLVNSGELQGFRVGKQWRVSKHSLFCFSEKR